MKRAALTAILALLLPTAAHAADAQGHYNSLGLGTLSCGKWTEDRQAKNGLADAEFAWVTGYLTAFNRMMALDGNVSSQTDSAGMEAWIDGYCQAHPLDDLETATAALIKELNNQKALSRRARPR